MKGPSSIITIMTDRPNCCYNSGPYVDITCPSIHTRCVCWDIGIVSTPNETSTSYELYVAHSITQARNNMQHSADDNPGSMNNVTSSNLISHNEGGRVRHNVSFGDEETAKNPSPDQSGISVDVEERMCCKVCFDVSSGIHYGVASCEGCKGFFKRSIQKNLNYSCKHNSQCMVNKSSRNNCQYCRFQKCFAVGMKKEAVRDDRTSGGRKDRQGPSNAAEPERMGVPHFDTVIPPLPTDHCDEVMKALIDSAPDKCPPPLFKENGKAMTPTLTDLMNVAYHELRMIISWSHKVPGFSSLDIEDQMALLKSSFMELNVLRLSFRSRHLDKKIKFCEEIEMMAEEAAEIGFGSELIDATLAFVNRLTDISLDVPEYCALNAMLLTFPDAPALKEKSKVMALQLTILDSFRCYVKSRYPDTPNRYGRILIRLTAVRTLSARAMERFITLSVNGEIPINELALEMSKQMDTT